MIYNDSLGRLIMMDQLFKYHKVRHINRTIITHRIILVSFTARTDYNISSGSQLELSEENVQGVLAACREEIGYV